jgi:hypothetical protein
MDAFESDPELVSRLPLPSHVIVHVDDDWRHGWLIGREYEHSGWMCLVQYEADDGTERTERLPAAQLACPDVWLAD